MNEPSFIADPEEFEYCTVVTNDGRDVAIVCTSLRDIIFFCGLLGMKKLNKDLIQKVTISKKP